MFSSNNKKNTSVQPHNNNMTTTNNYYINNLNSTNDQEVSPLDAVLRAHREQVERKRPRVQQQVGRLFLTPLEAEESF